MTANNNNNYTLLTIYQQATIHPFIYLFGTDQYHGSNWCTLFSEVHRGSASLTPTPEPPKNRVQVQFWFAANGPVQFGSSVLNQTGTSLDMHRFDMQSSYTKNLSV